jgi:hypothetical protein
MSFSRFLLETSPFGIDIPQLSESADPHAEAPHDDSSLTLGLSEKEGYFFALRSLDVESVSLL